jgi:hypothetical protein
MVTPVLDPIRVPTINLSEGELADIEQLIESGALPKDFLDRHFEAVDKNVFGYDAKRRRDGSYIEQGIGSPGNMTRNCIEAYRKYGKGEPQYDETLARMEAEFAECQKSRPAYSDRRGKKRKVA